MVQATSGEGGKGDDPRPVDKREYDQGYLRVFGVPCTNPDCVDGMVCRHVGVAPGPPICCPDCNGLGYVLKDKPKRMVKDEIPE